MSYVASTLFAFLSFGTQDVEAQGNPIITKIDSLNSNIISLKRGVSLLHELHIKGFITSKIDELAIPDVSAIDVRSKVKIQ